MSAILGSTSVAAQQVRVQLIPGAAGVQVSGVLVSLLDENDSVVVQGLTDARGAAKLVAHAPGLYRVMARRIGFPPSRSPYFRVADENSSLSIRMTLAAERMLLPAITVTESRKDCSGSDQNALAALTVWDQVRVALQTAETSRLDTLIRTRVTTFDRYLSSGDAVLRTTRKDEGITMSRPFSSPSPDLLSRQGYIERDSSRSATYYGPDARVLLSSQFERDHCFGLVAGTGKDSIFVGLVFHPTGGRTVADIEGTIWLDRSTLELRSVSFQYVGANFPVSVRRAGGRIEFERAANGAWFPSYWMLRVPRFRESDANYYDVNPGIAVAGYVEVGATATDVNQLDSRAFMATTLPTLISQAVSSGDSVSSGAAPTATASAAEERRRDTSRCDRAGPGAIAGMIRDDTDRPVPFANVSFEARAESGTISDGNGCFVMRAPEGVPFTVVVRRIGYLEHRETARTTPKERVFMDIRLAPIAVALGGVRVTAERDRALEQTGFYDRLLERRKGLGDGWFLTPEDIERRNESAVTHLLEGIPSMKLEQAHPAASPTNPLPGGRMVLVPVRPDDRCVMAVYVDGARFYLNPLEAQGASLGEILHDSRTMGIDDYLTPGSIAAMEVYPRGTQAPPRYQMLNGSCGVILIWTKR